MLRSAQTLSKIHLFDFFLETLSNNQRKTQKNVFIVFEFDIRALKGLIGFEN